MKLYIGFLRTDRLPTCRHSVDACYMQSAFEAMHCAQVIEINPVFLFRTLFAWAMQCSPTFIHLQTETPC